MQQAVEGNPDVISSSPILTDVTPVEYTAIDSNHTPHTTKSK